MEPEDAREAAERSRKARQRGKSGTISVTIPHPLAGLLREAADERIVGVKLLVVRLLEEGLAELRPAAEFLGRAKRTTVENFCPDEHACLYGRECIAGGCQRIAAEREQKQAEPIADDADPTDS